jgi:hypothetical protein
MKIEEKLLTIGLRLNLDKIILAMYGIPCDIKLKSINVDKFAFFNKIAKDYSIVLKTFLLTQKDISSFISPFWAKEFETIKNELINGLKINFLRNNILARTISVHSFPIILSPEGKSYLEYIFNYDKEGISNLMAEDGIGKPYIVYLKGCSSFIRIQHIYHLVKYRNETGNNVSDIRSIIEWGGGYGDFAAILARLNNNVTYSIIDHPYMSALQYVYIASVLKSTNRLNIVQFGDKPKIGHINFISLNNLNPDTTFNAEMFVSTFALTESSESALKFVMDSNFFNAEKILISYQDVPLGNKYAAKILEKYEMKKIPISTYRDFDYYLLK